jgi:hypothetical protein
MVVSWGDVFIWVLVLALHAALVRAALQEEAEPRTAAHGVELVSCEQRLIQLPRGQRRLQAFLHVMVRVAVVSKLLEERGRYDRRFGT